jgi:hypothetical protein
VGFNHSSSHQARTGLALDQEDFSHDRPTVPRKGQAPGLYNVYLDHRKSFLYARMSHRDPPRSHSQGEIVGLSTLSQPASRLCGAEMQRAYTRRDIMSLPDLHLNHLLVIWTFSLKTGVSKHQSLPNTG